MMKNGTFKIILKFSVCISSLSGDVVAVVPDKTDSGPAKEGMQCLD